MLQTEVFEALGDPTRRRIVELLAVGDRSAGELADEFAMSRPAVSRHLRVLREAGVLSYRSDAQRRIYHLEPKHFDDLDAWVHHLRRSWERRLDALEVHLDRRADQHDAGVPESNRRATSGRAGGADTTDTRANDARATETGTNTTGATDKEQ